jgi:steroid delta-isomerase-like uncharacterized protein
MLATDHHGSFIQRFIDVVWNNGEIDRVAEFIHELYAVDGETVGPAWVGENVLAFRRAFPDLRITIEIMVSDQSQVAALMQLRGKHRDTWRGIPATGRTVDCREAGFWKLQDGKIISGHFVAEALTLRIQLGQIPAKAWSGVLLRIDNG